MKRRRSGTLVGTHHLGMGWIGSGEAIVLVLVLLVVVAIVLEGMHPWLVRPRFTTTD
jgi:hypothetical protein